MRRRAVLAAAAVSLLLGSAPRAEAHTDSDVVAVPAGSEAVVILKPAHGCGDSPTVKVSTRVPVPEAYGGEVGDWLMVATGEGVDRTVITWSGSSLPADQEGAFPVHFTVPDTVGELVTLPFVQECADGTELAWISGDPGAEFPAPRVLVLAVGAAPAASIDELPADTPGRSLLAEIVDVDNAVPSTTAPAAPSTTTTDPDPVVEGASGPDDDDGGSFPVVPVVGGLVALGVAAALVARRARAT